MTEPFPQELTGVKRQPNALGAFLVFIGYIAVIVIVNRIVANDFDFGQLGASAANTRDGVVIPVFSATVYLVVVTSMLGWWRPAMFEPAKRPKVPTWMWIIPVIGVVVSVINIVRSEHRDDFTNAHWTWIIIGFLLVGFSEELMTRGLLVTGFRSSMSEMKVMWLTAVLFGVMHGLNIFFGQAVGTTIVQVLATIPMGIVLYMARRISGGLLLPIFIHAIWDISLLVLTGTSGTMNELDTGAVRPASMSSAILLSAIAWIVHRKRLFTPIDQAGAAG
jgi:membrane protease YdiL (CAAX protease family)